MLKKIRKPSALLLLTVMFGMTVQSCIPQQQEEIVTKEVLQIEEKLTIEEQDFLDELDVMVEEELAKIQETPKTQEKKGGNGNKKQIDPYNKNNPYESIGQDLQEVLECGMPALNDIIANPVVKASLNLDGVNDYIEVNTNNNNALSFGTADFTMEAWIKAPPSQKAYPIMFSNRTGHYNGFKFGLWTDGRVYIRMQDVNLPCGNSADLRDDQWHHVAIVRTGVMVAYYADGAPCGTAYVGTRNADPIDNTVWLGWDRPNSPNTPFHGNLDEIRVWKTARTAAQIAGDMNTALVGNETGLTAYWSLNEGTGNVANDITANANHGTIYGATWVNDGKTDSEGAVLSTAVSCTESVTGEVINTTDILTYTPVELSIAAAIAGITQSVILPTFAKKVAVKYVETVSKLPNANAIVNVSKAFENRINNSHQMAVVDKKRIVSAITMNKYAMATIANQPLNSPIAKEMAGCLGLGLGGVGLILAVATVSGPIGWVGIGIAVVSGGLGLYSTGNPCPDGL